MGKLKIAIWILILYLIQNTFYPIMTLSGIIPELLLGFAVSYAALEPKYKKSSYVIIICAVLNGTGIGRNFPITVMATGIAGVAAYLACGYMRFIPQIIRVQAVTAFFAFIMCCCEFFVSTKKITLEFMSDTVLWYTLYTTIMSIIIYLILNRIITKADKKILIAQERN